MTFCQRCVWCQGRAHRARTLLAHGALFSARLLCQVVCDFKKIYEASDAGAAHLIDIFRLHLVGDVVARVGADTPPPAVPCIPCCSMRIFDEMVNFFICCPADPDCRVPAWLASALWVRAIGVTQRLGRRAGVAGSTLSFAGQLHLTVVSCIVDRVCVRLRPRQARSCNPGFVLSPGCETGQDCEHHFDESIVQNHGDV